MKNLILTTSIILLMSFVNLSYADGLETFANFLETANSYEDGTFEGQDGSTWIYWQCRGDQTIDNETPCLGKNRTPVSEVTSGTIAGGFATINFDYMQAFSTNVDLDVYVNGLLVGNVTSAGELGIVKNSDDIVVDIDGDVVITFIQNNTGSGQVSIDNFEYTSFGGANPDPEPTNHATDFEAIAAETSTSVGLYWSDAVGSQLPSKYVILAGTSPSLPVPVDGTPIPNDTDFSDGSGALNIAYGMEECSFSFLDPNTTYYFTIYSYTNSSSLIDYKTDGTVPTASAVTANITTLEFENFDDSWGNWTSVSVVGEFVWDRDNTYGIGGTPCAKMSGYISGSDPPEYAENDDWLISPALNLDEFEGEVLVFYNAYNYTGPDMELKISTDYDGGGDPSSATWTTETYTQSPGYFEWIESGNIDLSGYSGSAVYVAFQFTCSNSESATWEVDNILITGVGDLTIYPEPTNYPTNFEVDVLGTADIGLYWDDATGDQLPAAYLIVAGTSADLPVPEDGIPVGNDTDLSDGSGALNVAYEMEETLFADLMQGTTYYFAIYSYTNNGVNIDYKNDGTAPTASDEIPAAGEPTNYPTSFMGEATTSDINLTWTDAVGAQLPEAYVIYANTDQGSLPIPADGTPVTDDTDLSDGSGAINVSFGMESTMFANLPQGTTYYFSIYPYTNTGSNIDYKNDGSAPSAMATTLEILEPTNYPTTFVAAAASTSIDLTWTDATGDQLPEAYVIYASTSASLPTPADGTPVPDDLDLADGMGAVNVDFGIETFTFGSLASNTTYYFSIYPYVGSGAEINYKNDGTAPTVDATTETSTTTIINMEDFEDGTLGTWWQYSVASDHDWLNNEFEDNMFAKMNGFGADAASDDWLISPPLNLNEFDNEILVFETAKNYDDAIEGIEIKISENYSGSGDPYEAEWTVLTATLSTGGYEWTPSGDLDISSYNGSNIHIAFHYMSTGSGPGECSTWEVDNIVISGEEGMSSDDQLIAEELFNIYPNPTSDYLFIEKSGQEITSITIMSATGNIVKSEVSTSELTKIDLTSLSKGLYIVTLNNKETGQTISRKLILK